MYSLYILSKREKERGAGMKKQNTNKTSKEDWRGEKGK